MSNIPYTESEEYQQEIAEQYKKRIGVFDPVDVAKALSELGFGGVKAEVLKTITPGNMNAFPYSENYTAFGRIPRMDLGGSLTEALEAARANGGKLLRMSVDIKPRYSSKSTQQDKYIPLTAETADLLSEKAMAALRGATGLYRKGSSISFRTPPEAVVDYQAEVLSLEDAEKQKQPINVVLKFKVNNGSRTNSQEAPLSDGDFERLKAKVMGKIVGEEWVGGSGMNTVSDAVIAVGGKDIPFEEFMKLESMPQ